MLGLNTDLTRPLLLNSSISTTTIPQPVRFSESSALLGVLPNGVISGAPQDTQSATTHRLYANNSGGSDDVNITITVDLAANYSTKTFNLTRNTSSVNLSPSIIGGPYQFSISPDLPDGLFLGENNGTIWGIPSSIHS